MMTAEEICARYPGILFPGDVDQVPAGWLRIVDRYFAEVAPLMEGIGCERAIRRSRFDVDIDALGDERRAARCHGSPRSPPQSALPYDLCRECGARGLPWQTDSGEMLTACEAHGHGKLLRDVAVTRATYNGWVRYDEVLDDLVAVDHPAGD